MPTACARCKASQEMTIDRTDSSSQALDAWEGGRRIAASEPPTQRQTLDAWERFVTGEPVVATAVSKSVLSSWQRSLRSGVEPHSRLAPVAARGDALEQLRRRNHDLLWAAQRLFVTTAHLLARSGTLMLLTDPNGVILEVAGDIVEYVIKAPIAGYPVTKEALPDQWTVSHSDNGTTWVVRDTQSVSPWTNSETRVFSLAAEGGGPSTTGTATSLGSVTAFGLPGLAFSPGGIAPGLFGRPSVQFIPASFGPSLFGLPSLRFSTSGAVSTAFGTPQVAPGAVGFLSGSAFGQPFAFQYLPPALGLLGQAFGFDSVRLGAPDAGWLQTGYAPGMGATAFGVATSRCVQPPVGFVSTGIGTPLSQSTQRASGFNPTRLGVATAALTQRAGTSGPLPRFGLPEATPSNTFKAYGINASGRLGHPRGFCRFNYPAAGFITGTAGTPVCSQRHRVAPASPVARFGKALLLRNTLC